MRANKRTPETGKPPKKKLPVMEKLGARVRELRERAGLTQAELERASGISRVFLGVLERAEKGIGIEALERVSRGLNVEMVELFKFDAAKGDLTPEAKLAKKVAVLARGASVQKLERFEQVARLFFVPDQPSPPAGTPAATPRRPRTGRRRRA